MPKRGSTCMKAAKTDVMSDQLHSGLYRRSSNTQIMCCHKHRQLERHCPAPWKMFSWQYLLALLCETCPSHTGCTAALRLWNKVWQLCKPSKVKVQRNSQLACCRKGYTGETGNRIAAKYLLTASDVITGCNTQVSVSPVDGAVISQGSAAVLRSYQHKPYWVSGAYVFIQNLSSHCVPTQQKVTALVRWGATYPACLLGVQRQTVPVLPLLVQINFFLFSLTWAPSDSWNPCAPLTTILSLHTVTDRTHNQMPFPLAKSLFQCWQFPLKWHTIYFSWLSNSIIKHSILIRMMVNEICHKIISGF